MINLSSLQQARLPLLTWTSSLPGSSMCRSMQRAREMGLIADNTHSQGLNFSLFFPGPRGSHKETKFLETTINAQQEGLPRVGSQAYISAQDLTDLGAGSSGSPWWRTVVDSLAGFPQVSMSRLAVGRVQSRDTKRLKDYLRLRAFCQLLRHVKIVSRVASTTLRSSGKSMYPLSPSSTASLVQNARC